MVAVKEWLVDRRSRTAALECLLAQTLGLLKPPSARFRWALSFTSRTPTGAQPFRLLTM